MNVRLYCGGYSTGIVIKGKSRKWKDALIQKMNREWSDLVEVAQSL